jgi:hypothetical protein
MELQEIQERNKQIALMLGADVQDILERIYIDKMIDAELIFHNVSVSLNSYEWNGTTNIHYIPFDMLQFHSDWSWIMEAVEFIENLKFNNTVCTNAPVIVDIKQKSCYIYISADIDKDTKLPKNGKYYYWSTGKLPIFSETKKEAIFIAVSNFAKLYNEKKI